MPDWGTKIQHAAGMEKNKIFKKSPQSPTFPL